MATVKARELIGGVIVDGGVCGRRVTITSKTNNHRHYARTVTRVRGINEHGEPVEMMTHPDYEFEIPGLPRTVGVRDEYAPEFGRQVLTLWEGGFLSDYVGRAVELPRGGGFMVAIDGGARIRVECPSPRTSENFHAVDEAIGTAVRG